MKKLYIGLMIIILFLCSACSNSSVKIAGEELKDSAANIIDADNKYVLMVKNGYRENNPDLTYDKAFSDFFATPRWKYFKSDEGKDIVEFTGDCKYHDTDVKARIQFVVNEAEGTFKATYLALNEVPQNMIILSSLIEKAFQPITDTEKSSSKNITKEQAEELINDWIGEHMFPGISKMSLSDGEKFTLNNKMYYLFTLTGLPRAADILVDCNTGELFFYDIGLEPVDINTWYLDYRDAHD